jgi:riboflavin kinase / FMN adenylyltransferase
MKLACIHEICTRMRVFDSLESLPEFRNPIVTQGTFDGVHLGHRHILKRLTALAKEKNGETILLTFFPHPRLVLYPNDNSLKLLSTLDEKKQLLEDAGIDNLIVLPFTETFSRLSPLEFVREVLRDALHTNTMVVGYDHRFGRNREGDYNLLIGLAEALNFTVEEIPPQWIDQVKVSSTQVRNALLTGKVDEAAALLGRPYSLEGIVVHGRKLGRELGFPTANIQPADPHKLIPAIGVYAVSADTPFGTFKGMANIGMNPTIPGKGFSIEANLFDFNENIYEIALRLKFHRFLRNELKFSTIDELKEQLNQDSRNAKSALALV